MTTRKISFVSTAALLAVAAFFTLGSVQSAHAGLLKKHKGDCCEPACEPVCEPVCCEPAPISKTLVITNCKLCKPVCVDVCIPACCEGEPTCCYRPAVLGLGVYTYTWCCGHEVKVRLFANGCTIVKD